MERMTFKELWDSAGKWNALRIVSDLLSTARREKWTLLCVYNVIKESK